MAEIGAGLFRLAKQPKVLVPVALISVAYIFRAYPDYVRGAYLRMYKMLEVFFSTSSADSIAVYLATISALSLLGTTVLILNTALRAHKRRVNFARRIGAL